jgi:hypothetical protein
VEHETAEPAGATRDRSRRTTSSGSCAFPRSSCRYWGTHDLRHTHASVLLMLGANLVSASAPDAAAGGRTVSQRARGSDPRRLPFGGVPASAVRSGRRRRLAPHETRTLVGRARLHSSCCLRRVCLIAETAGHRRWGGRPPIICRARNPGHCAGPLDPGRWGGTGILQHLAADGGQPDGFRRALRIEIAPVLARGR